MSAVKKYYPSNGTEGVAFMDRFCDRCVYDKHYQDTKEAGTGCYILRNSMVYDQKDTHYPTQWRVIEGSPTCTEFLLDTLAFWATRAAKLAHKTLEEQGQRSIFDLENKEDEEKSKEEKTKLKQ